MRENIPLRTLRLSFRTFCLALCLALLHLAAHAQQPQIVAHVLDVKGAWRIDGQPSPIVHGQALDRGAKVIAVSNHPGDSISLVHEDDLSRQQIICDATPADPCNTPTIIGPAAPAATPQTTSQVATLVHAAFALLMGSAPATANQYAVTMTRAIPSEKFQEAVVSLAQDGTITLPPSPGGIPVGQYTLTITPSDATQSTQQNAVLTHGAVWKPIPFASPGLFHLAIRDAQDHAIANLVVLVVTEDHAEQAQQAFEATKTLADAWTGPNARTDEHEFLRAFLMSESKAQ